MNEVIQVSLATVVAIAWYSASALKHDIVGCFLEDQEIQVAPK